jgi:hypothetical protein
MFLSKIYTYYQKARKKNFEIIGVDSYYLNLIRIYEQMPYTNYYNYHKYKHHPAFYLKHNVWKTAVSETSF